MHHPLKPLFLTPMPAVDICLHQTKQGRILFSLSVQNHSVPFAVHHFCQHGALQTNGEPKLICNAFSDGGKQQQHPYIIWTHTRSLTHSL
jgi:hypothetical protein